MISDRFDRLVNEDYVKGLLSSRLLTRGRGEYLSK